MIRRLVAFGAMLALAAGGAAGFVHIVRSAGHRVPGGILIAHPGLYDAWSHRLLFGSLFGSIAEDIARTAGARTTVLEVGSGPGHLATRLAGEYRLDVTGVDLDPAMVELARKNAANSPNAVGTAFVVGDAAALPFPDASFDLVVSTLSMHHWANVTAGLEEIRRVLRPGGRALIWDFRAGRVPLHRRMPHPVAPANDRGLEIVSLTAWRWPWRLRLLTRLELSRGEDTSRPA